MSGSYYYKENLFLRALNAAISGIIAVSALFIVSVSVLIVAEHVADKKAYPVDNSMMEQVFSLYRQNPGQAELTEQLRDFDLVIRRAYFGAREKKMCGLFMLLIGVVILISSLKLKAEINRRLPSPGQASDDFPQWRNLGFARQVTLAGVIVLAFGAILIIVLTDNKDSIIHRSAQMTADLEREDTFEPAPTFDEAEYLANWPCFRGPWGWGKAFNTEPPTFWDLKTEKGVLWKTEIAKQGYSCPVIWGDKIFLTGADPAENEIYCIALSDGRMLWKKTFDISASKRLGDADAFDSKMYSASTPVTDGRCVYAFFGNGYLVCLDNDGNEVWSKHTGMPAIQYGYSSSLLIHDGRLIVQLEGKDRPEMATLRTEDGRELWRARRPHFSWASPVLAEQKGKQMFLMAAPDYLSGHDVSNGKMLWSLEKVLGDEIGSSAGWGYGLIVISSVGEGVYCFEIGEAPKKLWTWFEYPGDMPTPLVAEGRVYVASETGILTCLDSRSGAKKWDVAADGDFYASPVLANGMVFAVARNGQFLIVKDSDQPEQIAKLESVAGADSTPAFVGNRMVIRGDNVLLCVGSE